MLTHTQGPRQHNPLRNRLMQRARLPLSPHLKRKESPFPRL